MIKIDKNVPMQGGRTGAKSKYPFRQMEVGDSFHIHCSHFRRNSIAANGNRILGSGAVSTCREDVGGKEGYRFWRIK